MRVGIGADLVTTCLAIVCPLASDWYGCRLVLENLCIIWIDAPFGMQDKEEAMGTSRSCSPHHYLSR
jgi:hypothetical protein